MPATYSPIATTTLATAAAGITFSSIPATYTDLRLVFVGTGTTTTNANVLLNNDTTNIYSATILNGSGSSAASTRNSGSTSLSLTNYTNFSGTTPSFFTLDIFSYAGSTFKTLLIEQSKDYNGSGSVERSVGLYRSTSAIDRIDLNTVSNTWVAGTTVTLYGILKA